MQWADIKCEMVSEKGLDEDVADKIGTFVKMNGWNCGETKYIISGIIRNYEIKYKL